MAFPFIDPSCAAFGTALAIPIYAIAQLVQVKPESELAGPFSLHLCFSTTEPSEVRTMSAVNRPLSSSMDLDKHALGLTFKNSLREWYARQKERQAGSHQASTGASAPGAGVVRSRRPIR
jgi:hypothetical protein